MTSTRARQSVRWGTGLALAVAILGLVEAQFHLIRNLLGGGPLAQRELATRFLGEYVSARYPGSRAIVLANPFYTRPGQPAEVYRFEKAGLRGLRRGLAKRVTIQAIAYPEINPAFFTNRGSLRIDPGTSTPLSYLLAQDAVDKIADQHPDAELVVSLIGLPVDVLQTRTWKSGKKFVLLLPDLRMIGNLDSIRTAFREARLAAVVLNKPGAPPDEQPLTGDPRMEFDLRFLLITPENVDHYLEVYPGLFGRQ